jgi:hypothetical protein
MPCNASGERREEATPFDLLNPQRRSGRERSLDVPRDRQLGRRGDLPNGGRHGPCSGGAGHHRKAVEALDVRNRQPRDAAHVFTRSGSTPVS